MAVKKVLVCDDDQDTLYMATFSLSEDGWEVSTKTDCNNIIEKVHETDPSVILMDISIPEEGGVSATQILKKHPDTKHIPVIIFSANPDIESLAKEAGTPLYISKPYSIKKLQEIVKVASNSAKTA
jgi:two-component system cell cycle response regulator DivK